MGDSHRDDPGSARAAEARRARLAAALRDNLRRRKMQARGKAATPQAASSGDGPDTPPAEPDS